MSTRPPSDSRNVSRLALALAAVVIAPVASSRTAAADPQLPFASPTPDKTTLAKQQFEEGQRHYNVGDYAQAIELWKQAYPPTVTNCSVLMATKDAPCVTVCSQALGSIAIDAMNFGGTWLPFPVGSQSDETTAQSFTAQGSSALWIGVNGTGGSDFFEPGSGDHPAPSGFWVGGVAPGSDGAAECVLVTGSGWVEQDCSAQPPHPFLLFAMPN